MAVSAFRIITYAEKQFDSKLNHTGIT